jgi:hypothetical protein
VKSWSVVVFDGSRRLRFAARRGPDPAGAGAIAARWQAGGTTTRAVIGACYDGPFGIDLDAHLTGRPLASLSAELTRREKVLAAAGAKDIEEYTERAGHPPRHHPLPRLVSVIDEFASLVRDLPGFVAALVSIAQRGRSLGIHLILATQRPCGVVSAGIRANTNLRIALRVTDTAESTDVIDAPGCWPGSPPCPPPPALLGGTVYRWGQ